jgi:hypothetical protein
MYIVLFAAALLLAQCSGDHSSPTEPGAATGTLRFVDSGCKCTPPPAPPITVYVDGHPYSFPVFGAISIPLTPGPHTWNLPDTSPTVVQIVAGRTHTEHLVTNSNCPDGCDTGTFGDP